jgi:hypothetical protein
LAKRCKILRAPAGPPPDFDPATRLNGHSDRFVPGTDPVLIRDAKVWTGHHNGKEIIHGDVLLDRGLIVKVGKVSREDYKHLKGLRVVNARGRWVTPGLVDLHSHIGVDSSPHLSGGFSLYHMNRYVLNIDKALRIPTRTRPPSSPG